MTDLEGGGRKEQPTDGRADRRSTAAVAWLDFAAVESCGANGVLPLGGEDCVEMARAVLGIAAAGRGAAAAEVGLIAARVPGLAGWLGRYVAAVGDGDGAMPLLDALARALVLPGDDRAIGPSGHGPPVSEARLLRDAIRFAGADAALREHFERAVAAARLEAMRELAYGAGHEINNPLANIATRAQALLLEETDPERRRRLSTIVDQSFRARDMIGGLMVFARPPKPRREAVDVGTIAAAAIEAVRSQAAARSVRLEYSPLPAPLCVLVDKVQAEEAVRVVLVNAIEAAASSGRVVVRVSRDRGDETGRCDISVEDNGRGMPLEQVKRAFDPFYSGREAGRGAGMGLPKAWRLIESSGGTVLIESRPGQGTRVVIRLPVEDAAAAGSTGPSQGER